MTAALEGGEWSAARPGRTLPPGKTRDPFYRKLGGPQGRSGRAENLVPTGIRSRTAQPAVSRYLVTSYKYRNLGFCAYSLLHRVVYSTPGRQTHTLAPKGFVMSGNTHGKSPSVLHASLISHCV